MSIIINSINIRDLEKFKKTTTCKVLKVEGFKQRSITVEYIIEKNKYTKFCTSSSSGISVVGDILVLYYDSLDHDNVKVVWKEKKLY